MQIFLLSINSYIIACNSLKFSGIDIQLHIASISFRLTLRSFVWFTMFKATNTYKWLYMYFRKINAVNGAVPEYTMLYVRKINVTDHHFCICTYVLQNNTMFYKKNLVNWYKRRMRVNTIKKEIFESYT